MVNDMEIQLNSKIKWKYKEIDTLNFEVSAFYIYINNNIYNTLLLYEKHHNRK